MKNAALIEGDNWNSAPACSNAGPALLDVPVFRENVYF